MKLANYPAILLLLAGCSTPKFHTEPDPCCFDQRCIQQRSDCARVMNELWMARLKEFQRSNTVWQMSRSQTNYLKATP